MRIGVFIVPGGEHPRLTVDQIVAADRAGLDLVGVQDHPYQRRFLDTWTLLSYAAARRPSGSRCCPTCSTCRCASRRCWPRRPPSLDVLSGGRVELGLGAGAFWDGGRGDGRPAAHAGRVGRRARGGDRLIRACLRRRGRARRRRALPARGRQARPAARAPDRASGSAPTARGCCASPAGSATAGCHRRRPLHAEARRSPATSDRRGGARRGPRPGGRSSVPRTSASTTRPSSSTLNASRASQASCASTPRW